jgi:hypothetical protein
MRSPSPSPSEAEISVLGSLSAPAPYQLCLRADEASHVFELSLCAADQAGANRVRLRRPSS